MDQSQAAQPKTSGLAIAALVTGLLGCLSVVGLVLGIVALFRIRRTGDKGRNLAIGGIVAFAAWTVLFVVLASFGVLRFSAYVGLDRQPESSVSGAGPLPFRVGQCLDLRGEELRYESVVLACDSPHDGQIVHRYDAPPGLYPGDQAFKAQAWDECQRAKVKIRLPLPPPPPRITLSMRYTTEGAWAAGFRHVFCYVKATDGKLNGSILKE
ncbi:DUF4190 domain-containing protein [Actinomadura decatromicini]|uniref:DUF4190 domain-containing protein n=1 Tax=Actinomadura decatromicini TaxID=2604572 RepID=A0A5D3FFD5_9ACTN|nr:DUF4190 domain-containing protein [Actinomadura decatromicini]TYK46692.1 DUF4190 domain-containing protein [Actinomadura decatromicini]